MNAGTGPGGLPGLAARVLAWAAASWRYTLLPWCRTFPVELAQAIWSRRVRSCLATLPLAACVLAALRLLPAVYGRYALAHAAGNAARQVQLKGEERVLRELRRQAFELGLTEAALDPGTFHLDQEAAEQGSLCTVSYAFTHVVRFYGLATLPMRIEAKVTRQVVPPPVTLPEEGVQSLSQ